MRNKDKQDSNRIWFFFVLVIVLGGIYLVWGQSNTAQTLYEVGFLRYKASQQLENDPGYALSALQQGDYDRAIAAGNHWAAARTPLEDQYETITAAGWFGEASLLTLPYTRYDQGTEKTVILLHGYQDSAAEARAWAAYWWEQGYNVLIPLQRGYGAAAEENYVPTTFGVYEQFDLYDLIVAAGLTEQTVLVHGKGAGAAAALLLAANGDLSGAGLDGIVAESVYDNLGTLAREQLKRQFNMGDFLVGRFLRYHIKRNLGYDVDSVDLCAAARNATVPALFLCGEEDGFLGAEKTKAVCEQWAGQKTLATLPGAYRMLWASCGQEYRASLDTFLANNAGT